MTQDVNGEQFKKVMEQITKLLAVTEKSANASQQEVENAIALANKLMQKYNIEQAELNEYQQNGREDVINPLTEERFNLKEMNFKGRAKTLQKWMTDLLAVVDYYFSVCTVFIPSRGVLIMYGRKHDIKLARFIYGYLLNEFTRLCDDYAKTLKFHRGVRGPEAHEQYKRARHAFLFGLCEGINLKLYEVRQQVARESHNAQQALVFVNERGVKAREFMQSLNEKVKQSKDYKLGEDLRDIKYQGLLAAQSINIPTVLEAGATSAVGVLKKGK